MTKYLKAIFTFFSSNNKLQNNSPKSGKRFLASPVRPILAKQSAVNNIVIVGLVSYSTAATFIRYSAYLFGVGIYLTLFSTHIGLLPVNVLISIMEHVIHNARRTLVGITYLLENPLINQATLTEIHQYLTPYIRSHESIFFDLLLRIVNYLEGCNHPDFPRVEGLLEDYRDVGNDLLVRYREIERALGISLGDSPIPLQDVEC